MESLFDKFWGMGSGNSSFNGTVGFLFFSLLIPFSEEAIDNHEELSRHNTFWNSGIVDVQENILIRVSHATG